jgi:hypothetical protein
MSLVRMVLAGFVLTRICASSAFILRDGASNLLEAASFTIALIGLVLVALVIAGMRSAGHPKLAAHRVMDGRSSRPVTAR